MKVLIFHRLTIGTNHEFNTRDIDHALDRSQIELKSIQWMQNQLIEQTFDPC